MCWVTEGETREADVCKVKMKAQRAGRTAQWIKALTAISDNLFDPQKPNDRRKELTLSLS